MRSTSRRAVFTGQGIISPIGLTPAAFWESLEHGRSGVHLIQAFDPASLPARFAGEVRDFDAKHYVDKKDRKSLRMMSRTIQLSVAAAQQALDNSEVKKAGLDPTRFGVIFGASLIASELEELAPAAQISANGSRVPVDLEKWGEAGIPAIPPLWMLKYLPNMLACHVSILHDAQGPCNTITQSDVAGLLAVGEAFRLIERDGGDFFLVGGGESRINLLGISRQHLYQPFSHYRGAPEQACRPFDRHRDGMVLGEGAGVLALEELDHARRRGARIDAELVGFGAAFDRDRDGRGVARAIRAALDDASVGLDEVDHVNAQGISTVAGDIQEARGIRDALDAATPSVPVFAAKSYFGNLGAGSAPVELAASLLAFQHGVLPPTLNYEEPDPNCPVKVVAGSPRPITRPYVVKVGFTGLGQCAALVCRRWDEAP